MSRARSFFFFLSFFFFFLPWMVLWGICPINYFLQFICIQYGLVSWLEPKSRIFRVYVLINLCFQWNCNGKYCAKEAFLPISLYETSMFMKHFCGKSNFHSGLLFSYSVVIILCVMSSIPVVFKCNKKSRGLGPFRMIMQRDLL